jgi:probable FeS assembly SUF system protein SufT
MTTSSSDVITLSRDCDAVQIPAGTKTTLPKGTPLMITQSLGGTYTVAPQTGGLFSIARNDADALGLHVSTESIQAAGPVEEKQIWEQLKTCFDPEIPVNIVDLGLVYDLKVSPGTSGGSRVDVKMTLTAQGCGMGPHIAADAKSKILSIAGVEDADVQVVWDPPWNQSMISADGKAKLGMI